MEEKKHFKIFGYTIWRILAYFIIYSFAGYIVETLFCIVKYGVWESRQSFLYGPFCAIYGLGAVVIILSLGKLNKSYHTLFFAGCIVGSILEYIISWLGELLFNVRWWDYSNLPLNLNGRICILYSVFWGILSIYVIHKLNPMVDKIIEWIKGKFSIKFIKCSVVVLIIALIIDGLITSYAIVSFMMRTIINYNIDVSNKDKIQALYDDMYSDEKVSNFIYKHFSDEKMLMIFPRLKVEDSSKKVIYFSDLMPDLNTYYLKIWSGDFSKYSIIKNY